MQDSWIGIDWQEMVFFSGGKEIEYGFKGKGTTTHLLVDGNGSPIAFTSTPTNGDERQQVEPFLDRVEKHISGVLARGSIPIFEADKGCDAEQLRDKLLKRKIFPWICRRRKPGKEAEKVESVLKRIRWKVERAISWGKSKEQSLGYKENVGVWLLDGKEKCAMGKDF